LLATVVERQLGLPVKSPHKSAMRRFGGGKGLTRQNQPQTGFACTCIADNNDLSVLKGNEWSLLATTMSTLHIWISVPRIAANKGGFVWNAPAKKRFFFMVASSATQSPVSTRERRSLSEIELRIRPSAEKDTDTTPLACPSTLTLQEGMKPARNKSASMGIVSRIGV